MNKNPYDARAVANGLLDASDALGLSVSNLALQKIIFFAHCDFLLERRARLVDLNFEAWKHGPVIPVLYHQFKRYGDQPILGRATAICAKSGEDIPVIPVVEISDFLFEVCNRYGRMSAWALRDLSHAQGGPWDIVWHSSRSIVGMSISDEIILQSVPIRVTEGARRHSFVH